MAGGGLPDNCQPSSAEKERVGGDTTQKSKAASTEPRTRAILGEDLNIFSSKDLKFMAPGQLLSL